VLKLVYDEDWSRVAPGTGKRGNDLGGGHATAKKNIVER